jgi:hypothetical protein
MQYAKDSFYFALRNRLATINPSRVIQVRSIERPAILVDDAESPASQPPEDTFLLRWSALTAGGSIALRLDCMSCQILYRTGGTQLKSGLDRGRALTEMDKELQLMLMPSSTTKVNYTTTPATPMSTNVFWSTASFAPVVVAREQLERTASVQVFSFFEPGE